MLKKSKIGQQPQRRPKGALLTAAEACKFLGVRAQTVYAYVSRGWLTPLPNPRGRGSLYPRAELENLLARSRARAGHGATAASALRWGEPVLESSITAIGTDNLYYRGRAVADLLERKTTFEQVAELLWSGDLPAHPPVWPTANFVASIPACATSDSGCELSRQLFAMASASACADLDGSIELTDKTVQRARGFLQQAAGIFKPRLTKDPAAIRNESTVDHPTGSIASKISMQLGHGPESEQAVDSALIACADHELNTSTFAARVAASTGADFYGCLLAALGAFSGQRHGLSPVSVYDFVVSCQNPRGATQMLKRLLAQHEELPGFGHHLYPDGDVRARFLLKAARAVATSEAAKIHLQVIEALIDAADDAGAPPPNLDLGLAAIALALDASSTTGAALFAVGRIAGWTAHILEQRQQNFMLRPRARYIGRGTQRRELTAKIR